MTQDLEKGLTNQLNRNGYSFQYAVLDKIKHCFDDDISPWHFIVSEFPVSLKGKSIHIDFVLVNRTEQFYMVAECKRADPAISNWCFVKTPNVSRKISGKERIVREVLKSNNSTGSKPTAEMQWIHRSDEIFRLAFELKSNQTGDSSQGKGQINDAVTQVLRGTNGLFNFFLSKMDTGIGGGPPWEKPYDRWEYIAFLPVIFTTAKLWVSDIDLSTTDIENGNIELPPNSLVEKKWIFYHYSQTPDISHELSGATRNIDLADVLYSDYTRTIPIVNSSGIQSFLADSIWSEPEDWHLEK
jgi:hypothetical protein